mmetsp:Transcript_8833/g.26556  ORF Transcript_8833/g.26556 Transcript_8833/m.26556 type:complete len:415 (-) Transcript_8833:65-1309(-)
MMATASKDAEKEKRLIATISGKRSADSLPAVCEALERSGAILADFRQFVVQDEFTLTVEIVLTGAEGPRETDIVKELLLCGHERKLYVEFDVVKKRSAQEAGQVFVITMITPVGGSPTAFLADICQVVASHNGNIETINSLSRGGDGFVSFEFFVRLSEDNIFKQLQRMREGLLLLGKKARGDIAVQKAGLVHRAKRLVVFDLSYTLITSDANDLLFSAAGIEEPAELTQQSENGSLDYAQYLQRRVSQLKGLRASEVVNKAITNIHYTKGAIEVVRALKKLGYKTAVISRGPRIIAEAVKNKLGLDFVYGNEILVQGDMFAGTLRTPTVDANRKADLLQMLIMHESITIDQVIAVGDGPVSSKMLSHAGLSVAFDQPEAVDGPVYGRINSRSLTSVLYLLGITQEDIKSMTDS